MAGIAYCTTSLITIPMNDTLLLLGFATTPLELISFVLALTTVALNIRQNHWAWLFAIISSAAYGFVFFESRLYGDMALQLLFISVVLDELDTAFIFQADLVNLGERHIRSVLLCQRCFVRRL